MVNPLKAIVEGLGSKTLTAVFAGILGVFLLPIANKYLGFIPTEDLFGFVSYIVGMIVLYVFKQWHIDVKTGGKTTTAHVILDKLAKGLAASTKDGSTLHEIAEAVDKAIPDPVVEEKK